MFSEAELGDQQAKLRFLNTRNTYLDRVVGSSIKLSDEIEIRYTVVQLDEIEAIE